MASAISKINAIRGMNDILPADISYWHYLENKFRSLAARYGYEEIRTPVVEATPLFIRSIGEATDIVEKETYTFNDRNGDSLTLRPEVTAGTVRAGIEHGLFYHQTQKLWYMGPVFRHERPQKGRYRQFYQIGVEAFGMNGPDIDIELLLMTWRLWQEIGLSKDLVLHINTLGLPEERQAYQTVLVEYFEKNAAALDEDSQRRLKKNALRILDSKNPAMKSLLDNAPSIENFMGIESKHHFETIQHALKKAGIPFQVNPRLVRGLDYYCHTVFEWVTDALGAQGAVCAGGRYDKLVEQMGGEATPAVGFAMGMERLILLLQQQNLAIENKVDVYLMSVGVQARTEALFLAEILRAGLPALSVANYCGAGNIKAQFKKADKSGAKFALILGDEEMAQGVVTLKYLREDKPQLSVTCDQLIKLLS